MKQNFYKIYFNVKCYCGGVYMFAPAHLTILANSEEEAKKKLAKNITFEIASIDSVKSIQ